MSTNQYDADGQLVEQWDDESRTHTDHRTDPPTVRDYTAEENAAADAQAAADLRAANEEALRAGLQAEIDAALVRQDELQTTILDLTNQEIKLNPAPMVRTVSRMTKQQDKALMRIARLVGGLTTSDNIGTD